MSTRVFVVEDDAFIQYSLVMALEDAGLEVVGTADNEDEAVGRAISSQPDIILMDVTLKDGGNGVSAGRRLRALGNKAPLIFITAYNDVQLDRDIAELEPVGRFSKPYDEERLVAFIRSVT